MTITLQPDQEQAIEEAIRAGAFRSVDEFIKTAIASLTNQTVTAELPHTPPRKSRLWDLREGLLLGDLSINQGTA
jgi:Arc/MetJ-type ribon-helix-helix transcriptional regulator